MEFNHGAVGLDRVGAIDLDLIVILRNQLNWAQACRRNNKQNRLLDHFVTGKDKAQKIGYRRLPRQTQTLAELFVARQKAAKNCCYK
jgi:hypothetical protein